MKYSIEGFSQSRAVELGLDVVDLSILRWITDFANTGKMVKMQVGDNIYFWVKYDGLLEDMPILNLGKDGLYRRLKGMVEKGVLEHTTVKMGGTYSVYRMGENFGGLVYEPARGYGNKSEGYGNKSVGGTDENPDQKINLLKNKSTKKESVEQSSIPYSEILDYLNTKAETSYRSTSKDNQKYIKARWNEGFRLEDFFRVIDTKVSEWKHDKKMAPYLRPSTLFGTKFESYLQQYKVSQKAPKGNNSGAVSTPASAEEKKKNADGSYVTF